jgi:ribosomal protein S13
MKSIRQWKQERVAINEDFDKGPFARYMGSTSVEVNHDLEVELKPKIMRIMDMEGFKSMPKSDLLDKMKVVISQTISEMSGSKINARTVAKKLDPDGPSGMEVGRFARMMGSDEMKVDQDLRRELRPKIERIMDMEQFKSMPKDELERELIAVVSKLIAGISSRTFGVDSLDNKLNAPEEADPIAKESKIVPSFLNWVEQNDQQPPEAQQGAAVSEPQHKQGEGDMDLKATVEKKLMELAMELESDGKGSRRDILAAMKAVMDSASKDAGSNSPDQNSGQAPPADATPPQEAPPQGGQPPMGAAPQQM